MTDDYVNYHPTSWGVFSEYLIKEHLDLRAFDKSREKEREEDERLNRLKEEEGI